MTTEWKLVPVEPTAVMISEGDRRFSFDVDKIYAAMLAAAPVPPAGEGVKRYSFKGAAGLYVYEGDFTRLTAERDALKAEVERLKDNVRWKSVADQQMQVITGLQSELTKARELSPVNWTDRQVLDFLGVALRNVDLVGEVRLSEIRQGFQFMQERQSAPAANFISCKVDESCGRNGSDE